MWISGAISSRPDNPTVQTGKSTLNSNGKTEAVSSGVSRDIEVYSPYGYAFSLPSGEKMLLAECEGNQAGIGTLNDNGDIETGEIKITAASGAYIYLKNDGSVIINGLKINAKGVIE